MLNTEVPYVRYLIGRIMKVYDYINRVDKCFRFAIFKGMKMISPLVAMYLLDRSCLSGGIFLKLHATFPNSGIRARSMRR